MGCLSFYVLAMYSLCKKALAKTAFHIYQILADKSLHAVDISSQLSGLLACMLKFAGYGRYALKELTIEFIRWVFEKTIKMINKLAREALSTTAH